MSILTLRTHSLPGLALGLLLAVLAVPSGAGATDPIAFVGATLHTVSGDDIPNGTLLIEGTTIRALGPEVEVPADAQVVDVAGKHIYPGLIHPSSTLGLTEISSVRATVDTTELGDFNPHIRAEVAFHPDSQLLPVTVSGGILVAHVVPQGGLFSGTSAVMHLDGWTWEQMTVLAPAGMHIHFPRSSPRRGDDDEDDPGSQASQDRVLKQLRDTIADARAYQHARQAATAGQGPPFDHDPRMETLLPLLEGRMTLFLHADDKRQIESALDWAKEEGFEHLVLVAGDDAALLAERLAKENVPVILEGVQRLPSRGWQPYDTPLTAAARLHQAGVRFAIADRTRFSAANSRNLPFHAAMAMAYGLPAEVALRSITLTAAEILGVGDRLGSLDAGKEATFIITDGSPLEILTHIESAWIAGQQVDPSRDRQKQLYERYRNRPRAVAAAAP